MIKIIIRQMIRLCFIGVPIGLAIGSAISLVIVPLGILGISGGYAITDDFVTVSFSPVIYLCAAVLAIFTTLSGSFKPSNMAGSISPIAAIHYQGTSQGRKQKSKKSLQGNKLHRMAWRNIFSK